MAIDDAAVRTTYWPVLLTRAVLSIALALVVTFTPDHSPAVGLLVFGIFAALLGVLLGSTAGRTGTDRPAALLGFAEGSVTLLAGIVALIALPLGGDRIALLVIVVLWAAVTAAVEGMLGLSRRVNAAAPRDHVVVAAATAVLAVVLLLGSSDAVFLVGMLGAYSAVLGVFLTIAALSLRWSTDNAIERSAVSS